MKKIGFILMSAAAMILWGASPAFAGTNGPLATTDGSSAQFFHTSANGNEYFRICDTDADGDSVYVSFNYSGSGGDIRVNNTAGSASPCKIFSLNIAEGKTVNYKSCQDDSFGDTCSGTKQGIA